MSKPEAAIANLGASSRKGKGVAEDNLYHVLLVDVNAATRSYNNTLFMRHSCKVSTVRDGIEALLFLGWADPKNRLIPDVVIIDFDLMPGFNGHNLLQILRIVEYTRDLRVVVLLRDEMLHLSHLFRAERALVLRKPLTEENVAALMNGWNEAVNVNRH